MVWFHITHLFRGVLGGLLIWKLPKTYDFIGNMEGDIVSTKNKTYNELLREIGNREIMPQVTSHKWILIAYLIVTMVNLVIDVIDFISTLGNIDPNEINQNFIYITFGFLVIALSYISKIKY